VSREDEKNTGADAAQLAWVCRATMNENQALFRPSRLISISQYRWLMPNTVEFGLNVQYKIPK
jgi:hypothetical protein